ncbi:MAG: hypothetical protein IK990_01030 [Ruminiclostridium sp.]|nr:hypothetical protein [Ruminiclostridium sp.]
MKTTEKSNRSRQREYFLDLGASDIIFTEVGGLVTVNALFDQTFKLTGDDIYYIEEIVGRLPLITLEKPGDNEKTVIMSYSYAAQ